MSFPSLLPTYARADVAFVRGEGAYLFDENGNRYLDFGAGVAVNALGHAHPHLVEALREQAGKVWHTSNLYRVPGQEKLAKRLIDATFAETVFFTNSGVEAIECSIKTARRYHFANGAAERFRIVTFEGAFHGRTLAAIAAGGQPKYLEGFGPKVEGFDQVPLGDEKALLAVISDATAALLIEPIQGESGLRPVLPEFLRILRRLCNERAMLLIFDEIQTGIGRTGKLFAHEWAGVEPDIMAIAKGIGGGFPVGACLATAEAAKGMTTGTHGTTFGGNPLAMAVGNAVLDVVMAPGFLDRVQHVGNYAKQQFSSLIADHPSIFEDLRGQGLMLGLKMRVPNSEFIEALRAHGMLAIAAGDNVVRLLPPLIIEDSHVREAMEKLSAAAREFEAAKEAVAG
ncbi:MAG TPA: aspartate aminotransferase family protein [Rhizomicrobium sp.]|nr:aspartate aminotransferase family protein [Rhizomicrobium sp.]